MNLSAVLIPDSLDAKQALRLQRFGVASLSYVLATALLTVGWMFHAVPASAVLVAVTAFIAINLILYVAIRSGFNLRFAEPSLTRFQILAAITVLMYIVYQMDDGRDVALFGCFVVFLFGVFRLGAREFTMVTLYTLAAYALVINLLMHFRPQAIQDAADEWMSWLGLAGFLSCFIILSGQVNALRNKMRESEDRFRSLTEMSSDFYWETDAEHRMVGANHSKHHRRSVSNARHGKTRWEIPNLSPDEAGWRAHQATLDAHRSFRDFQLSRLDAAGTERYMTISGDPVFNAAGVFKGYRGVGTDITARKRSEHAVRASAKELRVFADNVLAMTVSWDATLHCRFASKPYAAFFAPTAGDLVGKPLTVILGEAVYRANQTHFLKALQGHPVEYERTHKLPNGEVRHLAIKLLPQFGDRQEVLGFFSVISDITEYKLTEERIQRVAHHDSLTGLPNRLLFEDRLRQAIGLARRDARLCALLYLDLNGFKLVNDALGHGAGDELLKAVAGRIRGAVRDSDTVARVGGDEFVVILPHIPGRAEAEIVAAKVTAALVAPFQLGDLKQSVKIGASIGMALYPADARDADALVRAADAAMYGAKAGRPL